MSYSIVVAEDELLLLNHLVKKIQALPLDFTVIAAVQTGLQAYEAVEDYLPDLLITDIKMPTMTGIELVEKIDDQFPDVDTMIISGFSDFSYAKSAIRCHVSDYLLKPIDYEALQESLLRLQSKYISRQKDYQDIFLKQDTTPHELALILKSYLTDHFDQDIKLNLIAEKLNYTSGYLTKIFDQEFQCSPSKYLITLRIHKAQQLLKYHPTIQVHHIGEMIGYPDQSYFSRIFKKHTGQSPLDYRNEHA